MMPDAFDLLGLAPDYDLAPEAIHLAWLDRSGVLHPDRATGGADHTRKLALLSRLNQARSDLADPARRAEVLLARLGGPPKEQDKSLPEGFLMEMLEVREQLEAAVGASDHSAIVAWEAWANGQREDYQARVREKFAAASAGGRDLLSEIRAELNAWRYIDRMIEQLPGT